MSGVNNGSGVYTETYGTTSPITGAAPTSATDGQPMAGLAGIELEVESLAGVTLSGAGTLNCYILQPGALDPNGSGLANGTKTVVGDGTTTLPYDGVGPNPFLVGQIVTGQTSGAVGTLTVVTSTVLTMTTSTQTGNFVDDEPLIGATQPLWVRLPTADVTVTLAARAQAFLPFVVAVPRSNGRIKWVPASVTISAGSGGCTVKQIGQASQELVNLGRGSGI